MWIVTAMRLLNLTLAIALFIGVVWLLATHAQTGGVIFEEIYFGLLMCVNIATLRRGR